MFWLGQEKGNRRLERKLEKSLWTWLPHAIGYKNLWELSLRLSGLAPLERLLFSFEVIWDGI